MVAFEARTQSGPVPDAPRDGVPPVFAAVAGEFFDDCCYEVINQYIRYVRTSEHPKPRESVCTQVKSYIGRIGLEPDDELIAYYQMLSELRLEGLPIQEQKSKAFKRLCDQRIVALALLLLNRCSECERFISLYPNIFRSE